MDLPSLTFILDEFARVFDQGRLGLAGDVKTLFNLLVSIEIVFAGLYIALGSDGNAGIVAKKVLQIGFIYWIIQQYDVLLKVVLDGFLYAGAAAGNQNNIDINILRNPDQIFAKGLEIVSPAFEKVRASTKESYFGVPDSDSLIIMCCALISILAFTIMAIQVFVTYLEYLIVTAIGFILVPFAIVKPTEYLTKQLFGSIIGFGIKMMALAVIVAVSLTIMQKIHVTQDISWSEALNLVMVSLALCFISLHAPSLILSLFGGAPSLTSASFTSFSKDTGKAAKYGATKVANATGGAGSAGIYAATKLTSIGARALKRGGSSEGSGTPPPSGDTGPIQSASTQAPVAANQDRRTA